MAFKVCRRRLIFPALAVRWVAGSTRTETSGCLAVMAFLQLAQKATSAICGCTRLSALVSRPAGNCAQAETELPPFPIHTVKSVCLLIISARSAHVLRYHHA